MAYQIWSFPIPLTVDIRQRKTDPLIRHIIDKKLKEKHVKGIDINARFSSEIWHDDVSLLTAATACGNEELCKFLLKKKADPNTLSTNSLTALHYAAAIPEVPLNITNRLLAAKANPDGHQQQVFTPLQFAANKDRLDVFKALMEAGANPELRYGLNSDLDKKVETLIDKLPAGNEAVEKCRLFFSFMVMVPRKSQTEVFDFCREHFLAEHPLTHLLLFEQYFTFTVVGPLAEQYRQSSIEWLKDSKNSDIYIEGFIDRFQRIPNVHRMQALSSLHAVFCMISDISIQIFEALVPILIKCLLPTAITEQATAITEQATALNHVILSILCVTMDKSSKQKPPSDRLYSDVLKKLFSALVPFKESNYPIEVSILVYSLFADLHEFGISRDLTSVPDRVLTAVEIRTDEAKKEKLKKLDRNLRSRQCSAKVDTLCNAVDSMQIASKKKKKNDIQQDINSKEDSDTAKKSVQESDSTVHSFGAQAEDSPVKRNWTPVSKRWHSKLNELVEAIRDTSKVYLLKNLIIGNSPEFEIAKGSDGTLVFLGLRDDGTEVAVKRMYKTYYQELKNEKQFLRLPELEHPCIVRYMDFAEDSHFGYLILQLCEYTLEEYIQNHLPADTSQKAQVLNKLVKEVLLSLKALHSQNTKVLHRDIKPQNVLIDITGKARLADFGISRILKSGETTCRTAPAGTKCWKARELLEEDRDSGYKRSYDIQVAGMLIYYILSGGQHPFGRGTRCETNILDGNYSFEHLEDELAKDLVRWMISHEAKDRPNIEDTLRHPFFWTAEHKVEYLKKLGNEPEVVNYSKASPDLLSDIKDITAGKSFSDWKSKFPPELVKQLDPKKKYPENLLGLLRFIRNLHEHYAEDAKNLDLLTLFPDLFENAVKFAEKRGWITRISWVTVENF